MTLMPVEAGAHGISPFNGTSEEKLAELASDVAALKLPLDCYHLDAGWNEGGFPHGQGNPQADPVRFPNGLTPVGAAAVRATGMRFLAWFEPERAMSGTWLHREHPDWLLKPTGTPEGLRYQERDGFHLLDLGNPMARQWAIESISEENRPRWPELLSPGFQSLIPPTSGTPTRSRMRSVCAKSATSTASTHSSTNSPGVIPA